MNLAAWENLHYLTGEAKKDLGTHDEAGEIGKSLDIVHTFAWAVTAGIIKNAEEDHGG